MPGSIDAFVVDRDLAVLLSEDEAREHEPMGEPSLDDVVDAMKPYDESKLPDPFGALPTGLGDI